MPITPEKNIPTILQNKSGSQVDKRVRIRAKPGQEEYFYGFLNNAYSPSVILHYTNGIVFPYTPTITVSQSPRWGSVNFTHSIQDWYYFSSTPSVEIGISGPFTVQNRREALYVLGVLHFLRSYSKMEFGEKTPDANRGLPPPVLILSGYGDYIFNDLPVIIKSWDFSFPSNVDYVKVTLGETNSVFSDFLYHNYEAEDVKNFTATRPRKNVNYAYIPSLTTISLSLVVQMSPKKLRKEFSLTEFINGDLLGEKAKGFI